MILISEASRKRLLNFSEATMRCRSIADAVRQLWSGCHNRKGGRGMWLLIALTGRWSRAPWVVHLAGNCRMDGAVGVGGAAGSGIVGEEILGAELAVGQTGCVCTDST